MTRKPDSSWPSEDRDALADLVVGVRPFPSAPMTLGVVAMIGVGSGWWWPNLAALPRLGRPPARLRSRMPDKACASGTVRTTPGATKVSQVTTRWVLEAGGEG